MRTSWRIYYVNFIAFLLFCFISKMLYANVVVKNMSFDAEAEGVIWKEEGGKLSVQGVDKLREGEVLPDDCRICVTSGDVVFEKDGREIRLGPGEVYDPGEDKKFKDQSTYVKVAEGRVVYQEQIQQNGKMKSLGDPVLVDKGFVLLRINSCYHFDLKPIPEFEVISETQAEQTPSAPVAGDEGPTCASPPC